MNGTQEMEEDSDFLSNEKRMIPVGPACYQLFCTIVGLPEEPPIDRLVQSLIPMYQLIRLHV